MSARQTKGKRKMKFLHIAAVAAALVSAAAITGCEKKEPTLGEKVEQAGKSAGESIGKAGKAAVDAAKKKGAGSGASYKLLQMMRDMVETGTPLTDIKDALDYAVRSGNYSAADNAASTDFVTQQEQTGYTGRT